MKKLVLVAVLVAVSSCSVFGGGKGGNDTEKFLEELNRQESFWVREAAAGTVSEAAAKEILNGIAAARVAATASGK